MAAKARHVDDWVTEGIISRDQAQSICEYERRVAPSRVTGLEALAYSGSAVAAAVALAMVGEVWDQLSRMARLATVGVTAASLMVVGIMSAGDTSPVVKRLGETALLLAVPTIALTVGIAAGAGVDPTTSMLMASAAALTVAAPLYMWRRSVPQHVALFLATLSFALSLSMYPFEAVPGALPGAVVYAVGAGWVATVSAGWIPPRLTGEIVGAVASLFGSMMFFIGFDMGRVGLLVVTVAMAAGAVAWGVTRSRVVLTVVGIIALAAYVPWLASELLGPSIGAPFTLVAVAMALALWATRKSKRT